MDFPNSWATPKVSHSDDDWWVGTFYGFATVQNAPAVKERMDSLLAGSDVSGTILIADEGANGTLCAPTQALLVDALHALAQDIGLAKGFDPTWSRVDRPIFRKLKVQVKKEIVTFKTPEATPLAGEGGDHLAAEDWNALIQDPDTIIIDTRNSFCVRSRTNDCTTPFFFELKVATGMIKVMMGIEDMRELPTFCF